MDAVDVVVLRAAGINCDEEIMHAWRLAGARPELLHVNALAKQPALLEKYRIITIPGGFSYGDDIAAGTIFAQRLILDLLGPMRHFIEKGGGILGVCNGFQILVKVGLLPGGDLGREAVTVTYNDSAKFEARWVRLEVCTDRCPFLTKMRRDGEASAVSGEFDPEREGKNAPRVAKRRYLEMPVEHAEGKVVTANESVAAELEVRKQIAVRYVDAAGRVDSYPANPNGSTAGIAGLCDATGRVFGLMPHPDRYFDHLQHPLWTRRASTGPPDGLTLFQNAVAYWGSDESA